MATVGQIVLYHFSGDSAPAIVTRVHNESCVNLRVFVDGDRLEFKTSVLLGLDENQWSPLEQGSEEKSQ